MPVATQGALPVKLHRSTFALLDLLPAALPDGLLSLHEKKAALKPGKNTTSSKVPVALSLYIYIYYIHTYHNSNAHVGLINGTPLQGQLTRSTRSEIGGIGGPHPPNKGDDLMMDEMRTWT